jgi:hypothetical protein
MKTLAALALFAISASSVMAADDGFAAWWPQFQAVVSKNDAKAVASLAHFPMDWELGKVRKVETEADFVGHFSAYFPADLRRAVAHGKPVSIPDGYMITWKARGNEYSLYFNKISGRFALSALSEGPP